MSSNSAIARDEFRRSWRVVVAAMMGMGLGFGGLPLYSFGVFVDPLSRAFGWTLSDVGSWTFFANLGYVCVAAFAGRLADRVGIRAVALVAIPMYALALASLGWIQPHLWMLYALGLAVGAIGTGTTALVYARAVNSWFAAGRGTALGLMSAGIGFTSMVAPVLLQSVIARAGWRMGFLTMALLAVSALPVMYFWLQDQNRPKGNAQPGPALEGDTRAIAMRRPVFWLIAGGYLITSISNGGIVTYLAAFLTDAGLGGARAAAYVGVLGVASMSGRLLGGVIIDRMHFALVCGLLLLLQAGACVALSLHWLEYAPVLIFIIGFALGVEVDCMTYSTARYYGMKSFSEICGIFGLMGGIGQGLGSLLFGWLAGSGQQFDRAYLACAALTAVGGLLFASAYRYPFRDSPGNLAPSR